MAKTQKKVERDPAAELQEIGRGAYEAIAEMVAGLEKYDKDDNYQTEKNREDALRAIEEDPLSVEVSHGWHGPGSVTGAPEEYRILLSTGGPATRIVGDLSEHGEPTSARLEAQDWFQPWTEYRGGDEAVLLAYASCFYFGEG